MVTKVWVLYVVFLFRMNLWSVEHFLNVSWPFLSSLLAGCNSKATANPPKSDDRNGQASRNLQLIRGTFWKEIQLLKSILRKIANRLNENTPNIDPRNKKKIYSSIYSRTTASGQICKQTNVYVRCLLWPWRPALSSKKTHKNNYFELPKK